MSEAQESFRRPFMPGDEIMFAGLFADLPGAICARVERRFGSALIVEAGELRSVRVFGRESMRGEWSIDAWLCDVYLRPSSGQSMLLTDLPESEVESILATYVGRAITGVRIDPADLSLTTLFEGSAEIVYRTDYETLVDHLPGELGEPPDEPPIRDSSSYDQWFVLLPAGGAVGASATHEWFVTAASE